MSVVRVNCNQYSFAGEKGDEHKKLAGQIWPQLLSETEKYPNCQELIMDIDDLPGWVADIDAITIKPIHKIEFTRPAPDLNNKDRAMVKEFVKTVNQIVMPGFELLAYGQITWLENACTEDVQSHLDKNWRIIAVLPQPQQRRPDYILVRKEPF